MTRVSPKAGFNWAKVTWGRPDSPRSALCSYCSAVIPDDSVPLIMWDTQSYAIQFCEACQAEWWGMQSFEEEPE